MKNLQDQNARQNEESGLLAGYTALTEGVAVVDHGHRVLLGLSGKDPSGLLAAILTNEIPHQDDLGVYGLLLDAKGRVQSDLLVLKRPGGGLIAVTEPEGSRTAQEILGRYAPFSRVKVEELSAADGPWGTLGLYGPEAPGAMNSLLGAFPDPPDLSRLSEHQTAEITLSGSGVPLLVVGVARPVSGYDLIGPPDALREAHRSLLDAGVTPAPPQAYEAVRVEAGLPRFGADLTPDNFPGEAGILDRAVSFTKGCYPGQETVARMHYRGHPNRSLYRLSVEGGSPDLADPATSRITQDGKEVGRLTSLSPLGDGSALGYLHRKADAASPLYAGSAGVRILHPV